MNKSAVKMSLLIVAAGGLIGAAWYFDVAAMLKSILNWVDSLGVWGPIVFILIYILCCLFMAPASILTLGAGAVFGLGWGYAWVMTGASVGAFATFLISRYLARSWVENLIGQYPKLKAVDAAVAKEGWKILFLTRLSPVFPFNVQNYFYGLTKINTWPYFFTTMIGIAPGTFMFVYIGSLAGSLAELGADGRVRSNAEWALYGVGLLATVLVTVYVTRIAKKSLAEHI